MLNHRASRYLHVYLMQFMGKLICLQPLDLDVTIRLHVTGIIKGTIILRSTQM